MALALPCYIPLIHPCFYVSFPVLSCCKIRTDPRMIWTLWMLVHNNSLVNPLEQKLGHEEKEICAWGLVICYVTQTRWAYVTAPFMERQDDYWRLFIQRQHPHHWCYQVSLLCQTKLSSKVNVRSFVALWFDLFVLTK